LPEHLLAMLETLPRGTLRGLRDRAMLLIGFAGGLRRSEIVGLDIGRDQTKDGRGWIEILDKGMVVTVRGNEAGARSRSVPSSGASGAKAKTSAPTGSWIRKWRVSSRGPRSRPAYGPTLATPNGPKNSRAIRCAPALPLLRRSMSDTCSGSSGTPQPK